MARLQYIIATPNGGVAINETGSQEFTVYGTQVGETFDASLTLPSILNPFDKNPLVHLSSDKLTADGSINPGYSYNCVRSTTKKSSGKYYVEFLYSAGHPGSYGVSLGIANAAVSLGIELGNFDSVSLEVDGELYIGNSSSSIGCFILVGHVIGMAVDFDAKKIWYSDNGNWGGTTNPATNTGGTSFAVLHPGPYFVILTAGGTTGPDTMTVNFGATAFAYTAPNGFLIWNTPPPPLFLDFPDSPASSDTYKPYTWDGEKWILTTGGIPMSGGAGAFNYPDSPVYGDSYKYYKRDSEKWILSGEKPETGLPPVTISGTPITTATATSPYAGFTVTASGGTSSYTYSVASGSLPPGITLYSNTGVVSGTPTAAGTYSSIVLRATDTMGIAANLAPFTITVAAAWTPAVLSPWAWWRFDIMPEANGFAVTSVADSSGNGRTLTVVGSPVVKANAQNGLKSLNFAGTTSYGTFASLAGFSSGSFFAVNKAAASPSDTSFGGICSTGLGSTNHYTYAGTVYSDFLCSSRFSAGGVTVNVWHQVMFWSAANDWGHAHDGTDIFTYGSNTVAGSTTGYLASDKDFTNWRHQGEFGEVVILSYKPSTIDRQKLEGFLAWKWGIQASLPSGHPYKSAPP